jgi:hypothetical protein
VVPDGFTVQTRRTVSRFKGRAVGFTPQDRSAQKVSGWGVGFTAQELAITTLQWCWFGFNAVRFLVSRVGQLDSSPKIGLHKEGMWGVGFTAQELDATNSSGAGMDSPFKPTVRDIGSRVGLSDSRPKIGLHRKYAVGSCIHGLGV